MWVAQRAGPSGRHERERFWRLGRSPTPQGAPAPSVAPSCAVDGGHGAGHGTPPQRPAPEACGGGAVRGSGRREVQRATATEASTPGHTAGCHEGAGAAGLVAWGAEAAGSSGPPPLAAPAAEGIDAAALPFLMARALEEKAAEEEREMARQQELEDEALLVKPRCAARSRIPCSHVAYPALRCGKVPSARRLRAVLRKRITMCGVRCWSFSTIGNLASAWKHGWMKFLQ